jgi:hypothetical protein
MSEIGNLRLFGLSNVHCGFFPRVPVIKTFTEYYTELGRFQWPRGLSRGSTAARLLGLRVRIPPRAWMSVSCDYWVLSGRGLYVGLIASPEESYRMWLFECDRETSIMRRSWPTRGCWAIRKKLHWHHFIHKSKTKDIRTFIITFFPLNYYNNKYLFF